MTRCEVVEVRNLADADGMPCPRNASTQCFDCGSSLCESHTETCGLCHGVFCPSCLTFHQEHPKPASADHWRDRERKSA
jgi:predicted sulfurtransferase